MRKTIGLALIPALLLGCATKNVEYPRATNFEHTEQQKMQAARHWDILAKHEAQKISDNLPRGALVHVSCAAKACGKFDNHTSPFSMAYSRMLEGHLVSRGLTVAPDYESAAFVLEYQVQTLAHKDRDAQKPMVGGLAATGAVGYAIYHAVDKWSNPGLIVAPLIAGSEAYNYWENNDEASTSEVIITTSVTRNNRLAFSSSRVYYFNPGDEGHYRNVGQSKELVVTDER